MVVNRDGIVLFHNDHTQQGQPLASADLMATARSKQELTTAFTAGGIQGYVASVPIFSTHDEHLGKVMVGRVGGSHRQQA
jgi:sensor histidine kinase regulating citrate/malate metabolism